MTVSSSSSAGTPGSGYSSTASEEHVGPGSQGHAPHRAPARMCGPAQGGPVVRLQEQLTGALALETASDHGMVRYLHDRPIEVEIEDQVSVGVRGDRSIALQGAADA